MTYLRNTVILAKAETTEGTDSVPTGASNALLVANCTIDPWISQNAKRDLVRGYFGGSQELVGPGYVRVAFDIELAGAGTATTAPPWSALMLACGYAGTAGASWYEHNPVSTFGASSSASIYYYLDGELHKLLGARGSWEMSGMVGERPVLRFTFIGKDGGVTAAANATPTLTAWQTPVVVSNDNSGQIKLGGSYSSGAISGGTGYTHKGLSLSSGNAVQFQPLVGTETVPITQREIKGQAALDLTAAQVASFHTDIKANTTTTFSWQHGSAAGNIVIFYGPVVQRVDPAIENLNGQALRGMGLRFCPSSGNDELKIITK